MLYLHLSENGPKRETENLMSSETPSYKFLTIYFEQMRLLAKLVNYVNYKYASFFCFELLKLKLRIMDSK